MHSCEPVPAAAPPASGPNLLLQLGRLIIRSRSASPAARGTPHDRLIHAKLIAANPSTSTQVQNQPKPVETEEPQSAVEAQLSTRVQALWDDQIPVCIEVLLAPDCQDCYSSLCREGDCDKHAHRALLLERWTMTAQQVNKGEHSPAFSTSQWLLNAVRSQLHFSQLSAWLARIKETSGDDSPTERRRKLSRETCNFKKIEANCDDDTDRKLNVVYSIKISQDSYQKSDFARPPNDHKFPVTDIGNNLYLNIILESLPRLDDIPHIKCTCQKRKSSKDIPPNIHEEIVGKLNDLTIGNKFDNSNVVDDRMLTPCSESGKHKCSCDDESDGKDRPKKLDDRRLKEIAKYKRRLRKECKIKKLHDSTSSEGDSLQKSKEPHTSIPILQASRFDRFRAIGCYRNQTYLTLPATRIETKSPFIDTDVPPPAEFKKTNTVSTQTEELSCQCGSVLQMKCENCNDRGMVRSEGNYNLASATDGITKEDDKKIKKHKCDTFCDNNRSISDNSDIIKRPKLRRFFPIVDKIEKIVTDRFAQRDKDIEELQLEKEDTVFSRPRDSKRQKTFSISDEDYVLYEKCDYGTFDQCSESGEGVDSPKGSSEGFKFPDPRKVDNQVPSPTEMDRFRWRFDSAASMVFHTKTGLPLTSSPAPLRRGNNCFDFDDSINGISGIKSALFHPISTPASPASPASPPPAPRAAPACTAGPTSAPAPATATSPKLRMRPSSGLLGSFEESALKGRLEPVATVAGFTAELGAYGAFCPPHRRLPVTVFFYAPGGTNAPYMGHINLGPGGYRVARSGTIQLSLFNPHGTLVKMFVVLYELSRMPPGARTFLRQRTLYMPTDPSHPVHGGANPPVAPHKWLRYLIHLRFMTSKSGKLYLHTDIRIIVSRKADLDTATAHSAIFRPLPTNGSAPSDPNKAERDPNTPDRKPNRVFGGSSEYDDSKKEFGYENQNGVSYELRSFTYAPDNPKYSPR
ncbi:hypothetical protein B5X24_HaOG202601 [Helicoverpa armigera]|uniref:Atos-like conserved domain-containing protein n=1 Tax=Helicoverpa armigera TaxID=29058 RepID=A0A2W1BZD8_HELAM|nr:hypothetical protein B5X24_HaOG202601 [Helicoverpa armigera]